ncbi:MAG: diguanylate cyclase [Candidatus Omnitrophica bacterium]|nr:diguanylate cyclase [Candidatus Omnitrophota bacterium]
MQKKFIITGGIGTEIVSQIKNYFSDRFSVISSDTAEEVTEKIKTIKPSLIFLSNVFPDCSDIQELAIALQSHPNTETVPIIIIASDVCENNEKIKLFQAGIIDGYFILPFDINELTAYSNVFLQRKFLQEELEEKNELLLKMAITDDLLDIYNRRYLIQRLEEEIQRIKRYNYHLSVLMIDLDDFKKVNDTFGHSFGDTVLKEIAVLIKKHARATNIICRYGGEEIVILLPFTNYTAAQVIAERLRSTVEAHVFSCGSNTFSLTISIGLVAFDSQDNISIDKVIISLDKQLYMAKNNGKNRISAIEFKQIDNRL